MEKHRRKKKEGFVRGGGDQEEIKSSTGFESVTVFHSTSRYPNFTAQAKIGTFVLFTSNRTAISPPPPSPTERDPPPDWFLQFKLNLPSDHFSQPQRHILANALAGVRCGSSK